MVNSKLVVAFTDPKLYGAALSSFWPVFQAIEEKLDKHREHAGAWANNLPNGGLVQFASLAAPALWCFGGA